jgi:hypothetical protein
MSRGDNLTETTARALVRRRSAQRPRFGIKVPQEQRRAAIERMALLIGTCSLPMPQNG